MVIKILLNNIIIFYAIYLRYRNRLRYLIKKYIDTLKTKNSFDMKKKDDVNTIVTIISNFFKESLNLVEFISSNKLSLKGSELIKHLINLIIN